MGMPVRERSTLKSALIIVIVAAQVLLAGAGATFWLVTQVSRSGRSLPAAPLTDSTVGPATLESGLSLALARAQTWNSGAQLVAASGQVDWPGDVPAPAPQELPGGGWLTYVFAVPDADHPQEPLPTYTIKVERLAAAIVDEQPLVPGIPMPPAAPLLGGYPISSTEAFLLAEERGGTEYRRVCPLQRHLTRISLDTTDPAAHRWTVTYRDDRFPDRHAMLVRIDANTGEVDGPEMRVPLDAGACDETVAS